MENVGQSRYILNLTTPQGVSTVTLQPRTYSIGRHPSNSIVINANCLSRYHATLVCNQSDSEGLLSFSIIDGDLQGNKSRNGVFVNDIRYGFKKLHDGDLINLGGDVEAHFSVLRMIDEDSPTVTPKTDTGLTEDWQTSKETIASKETIVRPQFQTLVISEDKLDKLSVSDLCRLASFPEFSPNPIIEVTLQGEITYQNPAAIQQFMNLAQAKMRHPLLENLGQVYQQSGKKLLVREIKLEGKIYEQYLHYLADNQLIRSYIFDITERKKTEEMLHYHAFHDLLTGLPNRKLFSEQIAIALTQAQKNNHSMAIMFLDLDRFKNINDTLGHAFGDSLLQAFAQRLKSCLRGDDTIARWGGDEFTVLLPQVRDFQDAMKLGNRILESLKSPFKIEEHQLHIKSSIGIAMYPEDGNNAETLLKHADAALYRAKEQGRNNVQLYTMTMTSKASDSLMVENLLHQALDKDQFSLYYQPQINIRNGTIEGVEALIRWQHPDLGLIAPNQFIPLAEETGLIVPIGEWVLRKACQQIRAWQDAGLPLLRVGINLSPRQFQQTNLVSLVEQIIAQTKVAPQSVELEITEGSIMQDVDLARSALYAFREMGVQLSMDDFGTGYSSLSYLKKFPFDTLKIDRSFVKDLDGNVRDTAIIDGVMTIAQGLDLRVIAEGVETKQQLDLLRTLNCNEVQGYLFSKPLAADKLKDFVIAHGQPLARHTQPDVDKPLVIV